jgi:hypothetical protein
MKEMSGFSRSQGLMIGIILLAQFWAVGCTPPGALQSGDGTPQVDQNQVPFRGAEAKPSGQGDSLASPDKESAAEAKLPFQDPQNLPAGTLLTVRLKNSISADNPDSNDAFEAVVDQPVVSEGNKLIPPGAVVRGRVESARASHLKGDHGYVLLTLDSIQLAGSRVPVQTSSLFVRGNADQTQTPQSQRPPRQSYASVIRLEKGRRLVFRLTEPLYLAASQRPSTGH